MPFCRCLAVGWGGEWCGHIKALWPLSMTHGSSAQRQQLYSKFQLGNEELGVDSWLWSILILCCHDEVKWGIGGWVEVCCWYWVHEELDPWSGAHSHSVEVCVRPKQKLHRIVWPYMRRQGSTGWYQFRPRWHLIWSLQSVWTCYRNPFSHPQHITCMLQLL